MNGRIARTIAAASLVGASLLAVAADARPRLGIHKHFSGGGKAGGLSRPGAGGAGTRHTGGGDSMAHHPPLGWDDASRGPPRPGPQPGPGPKPDPGPGPKPGPGPGPGPQPGPGPHPPHPYPPPPPPPPPAWGWGPYWDWYDDDDLFWGFTAGMVTGAAVGAAAASAPVAVPVYSVGTVVTVLPAGCSAVMVGGVTYEQCGASWLKPQYSGTTIQYVVVAPPR